MSKALRGMLALAILALLAGLWWYASPGMNSKTWTDLEITLIRSLWIDNLRPLPTGTGNAVADDLQAAEFGHRLFFDKRLSANGQISCASCHRPGHSFTDGLEVAEGLSTGTRNYHEHRRCSLQSLAVLGRSQGQPLVPGPVSA